MFPAPPLCGGVFIIDYSREDPAGIRDGILEKTAEEFVTPRFFDGASYSSDPGQKNQAFHSMERLN